MMDPAQITEPSEAYLIVKQCVINTSSAQGLIQLGQENAGFGREGHWVHIAVMLITAMKNQNQKVVP